MRKSLWIIILSGLFVLWAGNLSGLFVLWASNSASAWWGVFSKLYAALYGFVIITTVAALRLISFEPKK